MKNLIRVLLVLCLLYSPPPTIGQTLRAVPEEPRLENLKEWYLHFALGIVAAFRMKDGIVYFQYPILASMSAKECMPSRVGKEMHLVENGRRYIVPALPILYRYENQNWKMWDELRREFEE